MKDGMMFEQRDIVLIPFPYSDLTGSKKRPALIISNKKLNNSEDRICCLVTSNPSSEGIQIQNSEIESGKLNFKSWAKPHRLFTISRRIIIKRLCTITKTFHSQIISKLNEYLKND